MELSKQFSAKLERGTNKGAWTYVIMPGAAEFFGTRGIVKVEGLVDDYPFRASFVAMGGGVHMLPIKAEIRDAIGKKVGDTVVVRLTKRLKASK
jgi:Domain of unknown function (DUF1905)